MRSTPRLVAAMIVLLLVPLVGRASTGAIDLSSIERPDDPGLAELLPLEGGKAPEPLPPKLRLAVVRKRVAGADRKTALSPLRDRPHPDGELLAGVPAELRVLVDPARSSAGWCAVEVIDFRENERRGFMRREHLSFVDLDRPYADLRDRHWAFPAVAELTQEGLLQGAGGQFLGNRPFTRFEMAVVLARLVRQLRLQKSNLVDRVDRLSRRLESGDGPVASPLSGGERLSAGDGSTENRLRSLERQQAGMKALLDRLLACASVNRTLCTHGASAVAGNGDASSPVVQVAGSVALDGAMRSRVAKVDGILAGLAVTRSTVKSMEFRLEAVERRLRMKRRRRR